MKMILLPLFTLMKNVVDLFNLKLSAKELSSFVKVFEPNFVIIL